MRNMVAVFSLFIIITLSILVIRFATLALSYTGLSKEIARFQARSAFTGVGFTTNESEKIVNHPVRRKIVMILMLGGNAGIVTVVASVVLTFFNIESSAGSSSLRFIAVIVGLGVLLALAANKWIDRRLSTFINWMLKKYSKLDVQDYAGLLHMAGEYKVIELYIEKLDWLSGEKLQDAHLEAEGVLILGITRIDGTYVGAPNGSTSILAGDNLILYGRDSSFEKLDQRRKGKKGDLEHKKAVAEQKKIMKESEDEDPANK